MRRGLKAVWDFLPIARGSRKPSREEALQARPVRNEALRWFKEGSEVHVFVPRKKGRCGDLLGRIFRLPDEKEVALDRVGSGVWDLCDGFHTIQSILDYIQRRHKLSRREAEVSVSTYLKILADRRYIGIRAKDSEDTKASKCRRKART